MRDLLDDPPGVPQALDPMEEAFTDHRVKPDRQELEDAIEVDPSTPIDIPTETTKEGMEGDNPEEAPVPSTSAKPTQETKWKRRPRENSPWKDQQYQP